MILLDTNVLLRMTAGDPKIGNRTRQLIDEATAIGEKSTLATTDERILKWARQTGLLTVLDAAS